MSGTTPTTEPGLGVLVIDDDDVSREMMINLLRDDGNSVWGLPSSLGATQAILMEDVREAARLGAGAHRALTRVGGCGAVGPAPTHWADGAVGG